MPRRTVVLSLLVKQHIVDSRIGRAFIAIRENTDAANAMGINVTYYKVVAFACSAAFTGIAGAGYWKAQIERRAHTGLARNRDRSAM